MTLALILKWLLTWRLFQLLMHVYWNMLGLGIVITHVDDEGRKFVLEYVGRFDNNLEFKYSSYEKECIIAIWVVAHFRCYLYGNPFTLIINHQPLKWFMESNKLTSKFTWWASIFISRTFVFYNYRLQLIFSCMWHPNCMWHIIHMMYI